MITTIQADKDTFIVKRNGVPIGNIQRVMDQPVMFFHNNFLNAKTGQCMTFSEMAQIIGEYESKVHPPVVIDGSGTMEMLTRRGRG